MGFPMGSGGSFKGFGCRIESVSGCRGIQDSFMLYLISDCVAFDQGRVHVLTKVPLTLYWGSLTERQNKSHEDSFNVLVSGTLK